MKVAVIPNIDKRGATDVVATLGKMLKAEGIEAYLPDNICGTDFNFASEEEIYKIADIICQPLLAIVYSCFLPVYKTQIPNVSFLYFTSLKPASLISEQNALYFGNASTESDKYLYASLSLETTLPIKGRILLKYRL